MATKADRAYLAAEYDNRIKLRENSDTAFARSYHVLEDLEKQHGTVKKLEAWAKLLVDDRLIDPTWKATMEEKADYKAQTGEEQLRTVSGVVRVAAALLIHHSYPQNYTPRRGAAPALGAS